MRKSIFLKTGKEKNCTENRHRKPRGEVRIHFKELGKETQKLRGVKDQRRRGEEATVNQKHKTLRIEEQKYKV